MTTLRRATLVSLAVATLVAGPAVAQEANQDGKKRLTMVESLQLPSWSSYRLSPDNSKLVFTKREMDFEDLMAGLDHVVELGVADRDQLAIMGGSYGGFMTFWSITQTDRFKAAIGHAAISDWYAFYGQTDIPFLLEFGFGGLPWETKETFERFSPIEYAAKVTTPLLVTHGEEDRRVPITQAEEYFRTLKKMGNDVEFLRFPREGHGIREPRHRIFLDQEQAKWLDRFVRARAVTEQENASGD